MAIDRLQEKIRRMKNPTVVNFSVLPEHIPGHIMEATGSFLRAKERFCLELLEGLKDRFLLFGSPLRPLLLLVQMACRAWRQYSAEQKNWAIMFCWMG